MKGISLSSKSKGSAFKPQAATAKKSAFGGGDSDEDEAPVPSTSKKGSGRGQPAVRPQQFLSRAQKQQIAAAESQDASVFAYDEVFDSMKSAQQAARDKAKEQAQDREVRFQVSFLFFIRLTTPCSLDM